MHASGSRRRRRRGGGGQGKRRRRNGDNVANNGARRRANAAKHTPSLSERCLRRGRTGPFTFAAVCSIPCRHHILPQPTDSSARTGSHYSASPGHYPACRPRLSPKSACWLDAAVSMTQAADLQAADSLLARRPASSGTPLPFGCERLHVLHGLVGLAEGGTLARVAGARGGVAALGRAAKAVDRVQPVEGRDRRHGARDDKI